MKLTLFIAVVMFKCSRLSSAPTESVDNKNLSEIDDNSYLSGQHQAGLGYVSDVDDLGSNGVVIQFHRNIKSDNEIEARRRSALDKGFMRFGRAGNMMRFGRSPVSEYVPNYDEETIDSKVRKNDKNILRFGRAGNLIRFGRNYEMDDSEAEEYNDASEMEDFAERPVIRSPDNKYDQHGNKILRLGRSSSESVSNENFETPEEVAPPSAEKTTNKKSADKNILRFGRAGNMMRFGRGNMMRFGRADNKIRFGKRSNMMRFGRGNANEPPKAWWHFLKARTVRANPNDKNMLRFGRAGNLIRFGRNEKNLLRFGKRAGPQSMSKIYCQEDDCVVQENENQLMSKSDQLQELFGNEASKQGSDEYIMEK
jgi:hypothetical protein